jgi:GcrA cell cycle regulator
MDWDDDATRKLRTLWTQGHSANEIGRRLGRSKNSVVGRAHRLELENRPSPIRGGVTRGIAPPSIPRVKITLPPLPSYVAPPEPVVVVQQPAPARAPEMPCSDCGLSIRPGSREVGVIRCSACRAAHVEATIEARIVVPAPPAPIQFRPRSQPCCWPIGIPKDKNFRFCLDPAPGNRPYCDEHAKLAYVRIRDRKEDADTSGLQPQHQEALA